VIKACFISARISQEDQSIDSPWFMGFCPLTLDDGSKSRILLIAYHFPPSAAVGGMRMANFAKWFPSFGWEPCVLTVQDKNIEHIDQERLRDVEGVTIHKVGEWPTVATLYGAIKTRLYRSPKNALPSETGLSPLSGSDSACKETLSRRLKRYLRSFVAFPDFERGWIIPAILAAIRRIQRHRIEWIMTSCPPYSVHLIGLAVKIITGTRWVADFRDPWMTTGWKRTYPTCALSIRLESWLEKKVIEKADLLLFNVDRLKNAYRKRYAHVPGEKFVFIPNGIAPRALEEMAQVTKYECFTLSYTGSLYVGRSPEPVFQAISRLIQEGKTTHEAVRIKLVGHCRTVEGIPTDSLIRKYGLESSVEVHDPLPYTEAMEIVRRSQLALLFAPHLPYSIPAKVYDYLGAGVRILAIAEDGGTSDLICSTGSGRAFPSEDVEGIKDFIYHEMTGQRSTNRSHAAGLARFDVRRITEELASHLNRIATTGAADAPHS
jgi:glycosyltransferase involved in cell wall biosynthesis